jgi:asparagine synthetase B (glutamine-hydrolysing)
MSAKRRIKELSYEHKEGDESVLLMYEFIASFAPYSVIVHDGIDELLGGYWAHRSSKSIYGQERAFKHFWARLEKDHLLPLERAANRFEISLIFPYLQKQIVDYITGIPVNRRTSHDESKIFLRWIAKKYLPEEIIERKKIGFAEALNIKRR